MKSYKGFDKDLRCRGFQYEVGKTYEMPENEVNLCNRGFHACESPLEVLDYYFLSDNCEMARFCEVEQSGKLERDNNSTKVVSSHIEVKAEIKFSDLIRLGVEWIKESVSNGKKKLSTGDYAQIGSTGDDARIGSTGNYARIGSTGNSAQIDSKGEEGSVICCAGHNSEVRARKGSWVTLSEWRYDSEKNKDIPVKVVSFQIDGEKYKEGRWYKLINGEIVDVTDETGR